MTAQKKKTSTEGQTLEKNLQKLEDIVSKLEQKDQDLDESIKQFEEGVKLYKKCRDALAKAEKKISVLTEDLSEEDYQDS